jgi:hypothetical protein
MTVRKEQSMKIHKFFAVCVLVFSANAIQAGTALNTTMPLDGNDWLIAVDPQNVGVAERWFDAPRPDAKSTKVPWMIQGEFRGYAGYAWYWRDFEAPSNPHEDGQYLLRFWDVDYLAEIWVNGKLVGRHEGAQVQFTLDITDAVKPGEKNRIAVRVLSLFGTIDGFVRSQTPHGGYRDFNVGGILDSVELLVVPKVHIEDVFVRADPKTGQIRVDARICNAAKTSQQTSFHVSVSPANAGEPIAVLDIERKIEPGVSVVAAELKIANPRLWQLGDPNLYRLDARIAVAGSNSADLISTRFGCRDFRFENGYFFLNGKRVFWRSAHTGADTPISIRLPYDRDLLRRDLINLKAMGFNAIRFISTMGHRFQIDMCDEIGLMVYEESYASWFVDPSDNLAERQDRAVSGMILRDRNHPSVVMWGLLNETFDGPVFRHAVSQLPMVRRLDDTRVVLLGSGRFDTKTFLNGLEIWKPEVGFAPCVFYNPKSYSISAVTLWRPNEVALIPGVQGEYGVVRWTAPADGDYVVSSKFRGTGPYSMTDVHILQDGKSILDSYINQKARGDECIGNLTVHLAKGRHLDFVVGGHTPGDGEWYVRYLNNTSLAVSISSAAGKIDNLAADFSNAKNPNGPWSYGWLAAGPTPDASTFKPFAKCETEKCESPGGISNPGSDRWEDVLADQHYYPRVPHRELEIARLRGIAANDNPMFLSEYGIGSGVNLPRFIRHHEQLGVETGDRLDLAKAMYAGFLADWNRLKLSETFAEPEDFLQKCVARQAGLKTLGINAIRSNPNCVGYGMTGCNDPLEFGEGQFTAFRELKPGVTDAIFEAYYPVHWCTFAEPCNVYRGAKVRLEAVLSNEDSAPPGKYPARIQILDPNNRRILDRTIEVVIPGRENGKYPAFAIPVYCEDVPIDGPTGKYRFLITFQKGVAATGGESVFYVTDPADMPPVKSEITLWGEDPELVKWLKAHGIKTKSYKPGKSKTREVILVSYAPNAGGTAEAWHDLAARIAKGSTAIFLSPDVFAKEGNVLGWLPLAQKGSLAMVSEITFPQVYPKDEWAKKHPLFDGLPCGGLMDYTFYRELIPDIRYGGLETPDEAVAGTFRTSNPGAYWCDSMLSVHKLGQGRIILNAFRVRQTLGQDPTAERLLRNTLNYAAKDAGKPTLETNANLDELLKSIGY